MDVSKDKGAGILTLHIALSSDQDARLDCLAMTQMPFPRHSGMLKLLTYLHAHYSWCSDIDTIRVARSNARSVKTSTDVEYQS